VWSCCVNRGHGQEQFLRRTPGSAERFGSKHEEDGMSERSITSVNASRHVRLGWKAGEATFLANWMISGKGVVDRQIVIDDKQL
jgi:hypothetical protein